MGTELLLHAHVLFYTLGFDVWTEPTKIYLVLEILERSGAARVPKVAMRARSGMLELYGSFSLKRSNTL